MVLCWRNSWCMQWPIPPANRRLKANVRWGAQSKQRLGQSTESQTLASLPFLLNKNVSNFRKYTNERINYCLSFLMCTVILWECTCNVWCEYRCVCVCVCPRMFVCLCVCVWLYVCVTVCLHMCVWLCVCGCLCVGLSLGKHHRRHCRGSSPGNKSSSWWVITFLTSASHH